MFNALACFLYLSSASYLAFATKVFLITEYYVRPGFDVYPAMTAAYVSVRLISAVVNRELRIFMLSRKFASRIIRTHRATKNRSR